MSTQKDRHANYLWKKEVDYRIGEWYELQYGKQILEFFGIKDDNDSTLIRHHRYQVIDWIITKKNITINDKKKKITTKEITNIELKSRTCKKDTYPTTMYPINKFRKQIDNLNNNKIQKAYSVFIFADCIAYYEITKDSEKEVTIAEGGRSDRGYRESSTYAYIPIDKLKIIKTLDYHQPDDSLPY